MPPPYEICIESLEIHLRDSRQDTVSLKRLATVSPSSKPNQFQTRTRKCASVQTALMKPNLGWYPLSNLCECAVSMQALLHAVGFAILRHHHSPRCCPVCKAAGGRPTGLQCQHVGCCKGVPRSIGVCHLFHLHFSSPVLNAVQIRVLGCVQRWQVDCTSTDDVGSGSSMRLHRQAITAPLTEGILFCPMTHRGKKPI